ncbi:hypothetical protein, partial [Litorivivens sp.]|uniref:hypothetical protein n=1 Tax=Litorivivens sp. TaxID=2020868 RepID=UPI003563C073
EVLARATADKSLQDRTEMRLLKLENESYKAGLHAPLTRDHVNTFIFADDETYSTELSRVIAAEIGRQEATEKRIEEKRAKEQAPPPAEERQIDIEEVAPREVEAESSGVTVTCVFKPYVPVGATAEALEISLRNQMEDAGFTSLESITVTGL